MLPLSSHHFHKHISSLEKDNNSSNEPRKEKHYNWSFWKYRNQRQLSLSVALCKLAWRSSHRYRMLVSEIKSKRAKKKIGWWQFNGRMRTRKGNVQSNKQMNHLIRERYNAKLSLKRSLARWTFLGCILFLHNSKLVFSFNLSKFIRFLCVSSLQINLFVFCSVKYFSSSIFNLNS